MRNDAPARPALLLGFANTQPRVMRPAVEGVVDAMRE
jgi:hypothetical protein